MKREAFDEAMASLSDAERDAVRRLAKPHLWTKLRVSKLFVKGTLSVGTDSYSIYFQRDKPLTWCRCGGCDGSPRQFALASLYFGGHPIPNYTAPNVSATMTTSEKR